MDLTEQMAQTLDRNDQVSVRMLLAMRQDPILHLEEVGRTGSARRGSLSEEDQERVAALLAGAEPHSNEERIFLDQVGKTRRLLERVVELDRRISIRLAGENSFYKRK